MELQNKEIIIKKIKADVKSVWFLALGILLGPAIIMFGKNPGHPLQWIGLSFVMLLLMLHRLSFSYTITNMRVISTQWAGKTGFKSFYLKYLSNVDVNQGISGRLIGYSNLWLNSSDSNQASLEILGQCNANELSEELMRIAKELKNFKVDSETKS